MPDKSSFLKHLDEFSRLIRNESEYFSHQTALFILGLVDSPPEEITIVSPKRRRNRDIGEFHLTFVYHGNSYLKSTQKSLFQNIKFNVSSLEKTIIDLLKDLAYAPSIFDLTNLVSILPFDDNLLLMLAKQTSDTVLKRVSLLLTLCGRKFFPDLPLNLFKRTPIKLDPREVKNLFWSRHFFCKYPASLLTYEGKKPETVTDESRLAWIELLHFAPFRQAQFEKEFLFIPENPESASIAFLKEFLESFFKKMTTEELFDFFKKSDSKKFPQILKNLILNNPETLNIRHKDCVDWVLKNKDTSNPSTTETLIKLGSQIGMDEIVVKKFNEKGPDLFNNTRFEIINFFADKYLDSSFSLSHQAYLAISRTFTMQEKYDKALEILDCAKEKYEALKGYENELGHLCFATGIIMTRLNRTNEAMSEMFLAKELFDSSKDFENIARAENSLGNLYFTRGKPESARTHYISGLITAKVNKHKKMQAAILSNLGMVEYDLGNFPKALSSLFKASQLFKMLENEWSLSVVSFAIGKIFLKLGRFSKALKLFKECYLLRLKKKNESGIYEAACLQAWIYELLGKTATAKTWWNQAEKITNTVLEPRARFVGDVLKALSLLYNSDFSAALTKYSTVLKESELRNSSSVQIGDCQHGIGLAKIFLGQSDAVEYLVMARNNIKTDSSRFQVTQIEIHLSLFFPLKVKELNLNSLLKKHNLAKVYDPFWSFIAEKLMQTKLDSAREYLEFHISRSPQTTIDFLTDSIKGLSQIIKKIQIEKSRAEEFVTIVSELESKTVHYEDYVLWQKNVHKDRLIFDGPAGKIRFQEKESSLKMGSIPHSILSQLFLSYPHPAEISSMYKGAWGMEFDPECDMGAFKSSLQRLKKILRQVSPSLMIKRKNTERGKAGLILALPKNWFFVYK